MLSRHSVFGCAISALALLGLTPFAPAAPDAAPAPFETVRDVPHGKVIAETYPSSTLGFDRRLTVYTPPGYDSNKKYPVLYLLHGSGDDQTGWVQKGAANVIMDNLIADGKAVPMLVVMPNGFTNNPAATQPAAATQGQPATEPEARKSIEHFDADLLKDIIPFIESKYAATPAAQARALAGLSMGGGQTLRIGPTHPDVFAYVAAFSSGERRKADGSRSDITDQYPPAEMLNSKLKLFWLSCGDNDRLLEFSAGVDAALTSKKIDHVFRVQPGSHEWPVWKSDLHLVAQIIFADLK